MHPSVVWHLSVSLACVGSSDRKFDTTKAIASSAVAKKVAEKLKTIEQEKSNGNDTEAYIMSIMQMHAGKSGKVVQISDATAEPMPTMTAPTLRSIVEQAKNVKAST